MSDRDGTLNTNPDHPLASALRALPDAAPQPDLWPDLARALQERHTAVPSAAKRAKTPGEGKPPTAARIIRFVPVALAAGVALAVLLPRSLLRQTTHETAPAMAGTTAAATPNAGAGSVAARADELATLHRRSQTLERWIAAVAARAPQDSRDLMAAVEVEDLIGLIDVQLGAAHDRNDALPLWRQRVAQLEDLATIRGSAYAIAANDTDPSRDANASLNRIN